MSHDRISSIFFLAISIAVFTGSVQLGIGTPRQPGPGFITFGASGLLGIISLIIFLRTLIKKEQSRAATFRGTLWRRVVLSGIMILGYALVMPILGYLITTFLLMFLLYSMIHEQKWYWVIISSLLSSLGSYYLFSKLLNCQFPDGLFGL
jgi:putative tricarboxylic transport membrane protein